MLMCDFYSRPYARGDLPKHFNLLLRRYYFYSRPYARGDCAQLGLFGHRQHFYSRPYARGDRGRMFPQASTNNISTHAPTRGATESKINIHAEDVFLLTPLREGRPEYDWTASRAFKDFYSRPYARGDRKRVFVFLQKHKIFLLTPLREGRRCYGATKR